MAGMSRRHYELIADALASLPATATRDNVIDKLADTFTHDNRDFVRPLFVTQARGEVDDELCKQHGYHVRTTGHRAFQCGFPSQAVT